MPYKVIFLTLNHTHMQHQNKLNKQQQKEQVFMKEI